MMSKLSTFAFPKLSSLSKLFRLGGREGSAGKVQKAPHLPTSFSPVTSTNLRIRPQKFCNAGENFKTVPMPVSNYWTWTKSTPQKNCFFWSNPYKTDHIYNIIWVTWSTNFVGDGQDYIY